MVSEAKETTWSEFGTKLKDCKDNQKLFYKELENLRKSKTIQATTIKNIDRHILTDEIDIMKKW